MLTRSIALIGCAILPSVSLSAQSHREARASISDRCAEAVSQRALDACTAAAHRQADSVLNATYRALLQALPAERRPGMRKAQRAWLQFRDAECAAVAAQVAGGTLEPSQRAVCLHELTRERIGHLEQHLEAASR